MANEVWASAVVMLDTPCSEVVWRVLATHYICQFPLHFLFHASPRAITFQLQFDRCFTASEILFGLPLCRPFVVCWSFASTRSSSRTVTGRQQPSALQVAFLPCESCWANSSVPGCCTVDIWASGRVTKSKAVWQSHEVSTARSFSLPTEKLGS